MAVKFEGGFSIACLKEYQEQQKPWRNSFRTENSGEGRKEGRKKEGRKEEGRKEGRKEGGRSELAVAGRVCASGPGKDTPRASR